jgi:ribosomal protein S27E
MPETKKGAVKIKGPGDPCPSCGATLDAAPGGTTKGVARCPRCGYVLTEPAEVEQA